MGTGLSWLGRFSIVAASLESRMSCSARKRHARNLRCAAALVLAAAGCDHLGLSDAELRPGVRFGAERFEVQRFARCEVTGAITDIAWGRVRADDPESILVAGILGFAAIDPDTLHVDRAVDFLDSPLTQRGSFVDTEIHDLDGDGILEFLRIVHDRAPLSIHGGDGAARWTDRKLVRRADVCDVDADGKLEIFVTSTGMSGVRVLDSAGALRGQHDWFPWFPAFADVDGDGVEDILYFEGEALWARNGRGEVLARLVLPQAGIPNGVFAIPSWEDPHRISLFGREYRGSGLQSVDWTYALGRDMKTVGAEVDFEAIRPMLHAIPIELDGTSARWASLRYMQRPAPVAGIAATRVRLTLFDRTGAIVYDEMLRAPEGERTFGEGALLLLPARQGAPARLVVAYGTGVWVYRARK